jgi:phosphoribosylpyrophosphate synthetase
MVITPRIESSHKIGLCIRGGKEPMDQQEFILTMEEKSNYLHVRTSGIRSRETVNNLTIKVFNTALEKHLSKILIDVRKLEGYFGYLDIFIFAKDVLRDLRGKGVDQVAVIDIHRTTRQDWFLEPVARLHELNIRVFTEEESALKWLGE